MKRCHKNDTKTINKEEHMKKSALALVFVLLASVTPALASGWDANFPAFPTLSTIESISAIFYLNGHLFVAVNYDDDFFGDHHGYLYRLDGSTWNVVPNSTIYSNDSNESGTILALSGASSSSWSR